MVAKAGAKCAAWAKLCYTEPMNMLVRVALVFMVFFGMYVLSWILLLVLPFGDLGFVGNILALVIAVTVRSALPRASSVR